VRRETTREREAWTAHIEGRQEKRNKYGNERGQYASKREADHAGKLWALESRGLIKNLREQVPVVLVEGKGKIRRITWIADFVYEDLNGRRHYQDVKGLKTPVYRLKKRLAALLLNLEIEEV
jgi:hypothetical protein